MLRITIFSFFLILAMGINLSEAGGSPSGGDSPSGKGNTSDKGSIPTSRFMPSHPDLLKGIEDGRVSAPPAFLSDESFDWVAAPLGVATGTKKALVVMVDFSDKQGKKTHRIMKRCYFLKLPIPQAACGTIIQRFLTTT
ncbi:MAG: hypothetical protein ABH870_08880 [bacterium]